ncbi:G coupled receptor 1 [Fusarium mundagurra]|uniref:G coupled receptor 1 n=1 Tax=Fusarium mundagurra TaxID=1567541 RepID=A0A8H5XPA9_9HYPO|nr:G coupled receptor 1 [Fusarium mundagurra]
MESPMHIYHREALAAPAARSEMVLQSIVILVVSILSILGAGWIIVFKSLRSFRHQLILGLAVSDFLMALNFLSSTAMNINGNEIGAPEQERFCSFNGFMTQVFVIQTDYWVLTIAMCTYVILAGYKSLSSWVQDQRIFLSCLPWALSLLWAGLGLKLAGYGDIGAWCWFTSDEVRLLANFVPRWVIIITILSMYARLYFILRKSHRSFISLGNSNSASEPSRERTITRSNHDVWRYHESDAAGRRRLQRIARLMIMYPVVYMLVWTLPTAIRIYQTIKHTPAPFALQTIDKACIVSQGFVDAIIYGVNESSLSRWRELIFPSSDKDVTETVTSRNIDTRVSTRVHSNAAVMSSASSSKVIITTSIEQETSIYVVINLPPAGIYGQISAFKTVSGMKSTFPHMRFWLLVGIGGGVPSRKADIRLGDVVLVTAVLPYKTGKQLEKSFEITGKAMEPPVELLSVVTQLRHKLGDGLSLEQSMEDVFRRRLVSQHDPRRKYRRPSNHHLWRSDYIHQDDECACLHKPPNDTSRSIQRKQPSTEQLIQTHCGIIGSAEQVMKNAKKRDELGRKEDVICFEMEATAVMEAAAGNQALNRCISIRGISDYADGHKNDSWHDYAALSAAVCAAELLKCLALSSVRRMTIELAPDEIADLIQGAVNAAEERINLSLNSLGGDLADLKAAHDNIKERIELLNNFTDQQKQFAEDEMKVMRVTCQKLLDETIHDLKKQAKIEADKADYVTRLEWEEFTKQIETTAEKSSKLATAEEILDTAGELTDNIIQDAKGKGDGSYAKYFKFGSRFTKLATNFRGAGNKTNNISTNSVTISPSYIPPTPSPSSQSGHKESTSSSGGWPSQRLPSDTTGTSQSSSDRSGLAIPTRPAPTMPRIGYEQPSIPSPPQRTSLSRDRPPNGPSPGPSN